MNEQRFIAERMTGIGSSGIRRVFDLGATLKDPIDLSIGQPDFAVPSAVKQAAAEAVENNHNGYTVTRGIPQLRARIAAQLKEDHGWEPDVFVTSGVSGGLALTMLACLNPGDEVLFPDPYFVSYPYLVKLAGGVPKPIPLYDDLQLHPERFKAAITPRTKMILVCSPANPTGIVYSKRDMQTLAAIAEEHDLLLISDEIYSLLTYDGPAPTPISFAPDRTLLLGGFGKSYGMTGWRMGYAAGPPAILAEMAKLQQYTFVCAPQPAQHATVVAMDTDMSEQVDVLRKKRDLVCSELEGVFDFVRPSGGFYVFPKVPEGFDNGMAFVEEAISQNVLIIPGEVFSQQDTHFRISYAAPEDKIRRGCEIMRNIAQGVAASR